VRAALEKRILFGPEFLDRVRIRERVLVVVMFVIVVVFVGHGSIMRASRAAVMG
jgi:hypothetical protein